MASTTQQQIALAIIPKITGGLSFICSTYLVQHILRDGTRCDSQANKKRRKQQQQQSHARARRSQFPNHAQRKKMSSTYHRLICGMSIGDCFSSFFGFVLSTWPIPEETGIWGASGNITTCDVAGFFNHAGNLIVPLYNASLATFYLLLLKYNWTDTQIRRKAEIYLHLVPLVVGWGIPIVCLAQGMYGPANWICWLAPYPSDCDSEETCIRGWNYEAYRWAAHYAEVWLAMIYVAIAMGAIYCKVRTLETKSDRYRFKGSSTVVNGQNSIAVGGTGTGIGMNDTTKSKNVNVNSSVIMNNNDESQKKRRKSQRVMFEAFMYVGAFFLTWIFGTLTRMIQAINGQTYYGLLVMMTIFFPLQGFFNFLIYTRPIQKWQAKRQKKRKSQQLAEKRRLQQQQQQQQQMQQQNGDQPQVQNLAYSQPLQQQHQQYSHPSNPSSQPSYCSSDHGRGEPSDDEDVVPSTSPTKRNVSGGNGQRRNSLMALIPNIFGRPDNDDDDDDDIGVGDDGRNGSTNIVESGVSSVILDSTDDNDINHHDHNHKIVAPESPHRQEQQKPKILSPLRATPKTRDSSVEQSLDSPFDSSDLEISRTMKLYSHFNPGESVMVGGSPPSSRVSLPSAASPSPVSSSSSSAVQNGGNHHQTGIILQMDGSVLQMDGSSGGVLFVDENSSELDIVRDGERQIPPMSSGVAQPQGQQQVVRFEEDEQIDATNSNTTGDIGNGDPPAIAAENTVSTGQQQTPHNHDHRQSLDDIGEEDDEENEP